MKPQKPIDKRPKCRKCRDRFVPVNGNMNQKHCLEKTECIAAHVEHSKTIRDKQQRKKDQQTGIKVYAKEYKRDLATAIQKLARLIDQRFHPTCIDCGKPYGKQVDGGHFHSRGSNPTLSYNLHNIHSQSSKCNQFDGGRRLEYYRGLVLRYDQEYADYIDTGIVREFPLIKLTEKEIFDKLNTARKLIRTFDTFQFDDAIVARKQLNLIIGIYNSSTKF